MVGQFRKRLGKHLSAPTALAGNRHEGERVAFPKR
jgi:hypothetical protein